MDKIRIDKLLTVHCLLGIAHEGGNTILDGAHQRRSAETAMLLDSLHPTSCAACARSRTAGDLR